MPTGIKQYENGRDELTDKQKTFVNLFSNPDSECFLNVLKSAENAGYSQKHKHHNTKMQAACKVLVSKTVLKALFTKAQDNAENALIKAEYSRQWLWGEILEFLADCKAAKDRANWARALELAGRLHSAWADKITVSIEKAKELDDTEKQYAKKLARYSLIDAENIVKDAEFEGADIQDIVSQLDQKSIIDNGIVYPEDNTLPDNSLDDDDDIE